MPTIILRCPACQARIKAPIQLLGLHRPGPGCKTEFVVRPQPRLDLDRDFETAELRLGEWNRPVRTDSA
jgi:hypothetical protein